MSTFQRLLCAFFITVCHNHTEVWSELIYETYLRCTYKKERVFIFIFPTFWLCCYFVLISILFFLSSVVCSPNLKDWTWSNSKCFSSMLIPMLVRAILFYQHDLCFVEIPVQSMCCCILQPRYWYLLLIGCFMQAAVQVWILDVSVMYFDVYYFCGI